MSAKTIIKRLFNSLPVQNPVTRIGFLLTLILPVPIVVLVIFCLVGQIEQSRVEYVKLRPEQSEYVVNCAESFLKKSMVPDFKGKFITLNNIDIFECSQNTQCKELLDYMSGSITGSFERLKKEGYEDTYNLFKTYPYIALRWDIHRMYSPKVREKLLKEYGELDWTFLSAICTYKHQEATIFKKVRYWNVINLKHTRQAFNILTALSITLLIAIAFSFGYNITLKPIIKLLDWIRHGKL